MKNVEDNILDITNLTTKATLNVKITEIEGKIPSINNLATTAVFAAVENKIPNASNLVKKTDYNTKINDIEKKITNNSHDKYIITPELNRLTAEHFAARLAQAIWQTKVILLIL